MTKIYVFIFAAIFNLAQAQALELVLTRDLIPSEIKNASAVRLKDKSGRPFLKKGDVLVIPDQYVVWGRDGEIDLEATLKNWREKTEGLQAEIPRPDGSVEKNPLKASEDSETPGVYKDTVEVKTVGGSPKATETPEEETGRGKKVEIVRDFYPVELKTNSSLRRRFKDKWNGKKEKRTLYLNHDQLSDSKAFELKNPKAKGEKKAAATGASEPVQDLEVSDVGESPKGKDETAGASALSPSEESLGGAMSCQATQGEACSDIRLTLGRPTFQHLPAGPERKRAFINWLKPAAQYIQAKTGLPASVVVAQAAWETGWGSSNLFKVSNAMFGQWCGKTPSSEWKENSAQLGNETFTYRTTCNHKRPKQEWGYYLRFETLEGSLLAYANNLLNGSHYSRIQAAVDSARQTNPAGVADVDRVVAGLSQYAEDPEYVRQVANTIRWNKLSSLLDSNPCQSCLLAQGEPPKGQPVVEAAARPKSGRRGTAGSGQL